MPVSASVPQADIDELAQWLFKNNNSFSTQPWGQATEQCKNRWRSMAKKMLKKVPAVVVRYAKEGL